MMEELRARYLPRFVEVAQRRVARGLEAVTPVGAGAPQIARTELHTLAGEAGILGLTELASRAQAGEADCKRWLDDGDVAARARCAIALRQLGAQLRQLAASQPAPAPTPAPIARRVVVVDDSPLVAEQVCDGLRADGCEARAAADVDSMLRLIAELRPQVVVIDVHMPGLSLPDLCARARVAAAGTALSICLLSGVPETELSARAREVGADGFVSKVTGLDHVVAQVRRMAAPR